MPKNDQTDAPDESLPLQAEADPDAPRSFTYGDQEWTLPDGGDEWPIAATLAFGRISAADPGDAATIAHIETFCKALLGPGQWRKFMSAPGRRSADLADMFNAILADGYGLGSAGE